MSDALNYAADHRDDFLEQLKTFLSFPSIGVRSEHAEDVQACARWLAGTLGDIGLNNVEVVQTGGQPVVYADRIVGDDRRTVLVYGHYDVQPADPLEEWTSDPFAPVVRDGNIYARGACDDKGQVFMTVCAARSFLASGDPPVNLRFMIEGEEEAGSKNLSAFINDNADRLRADVTLICDTSMPDRRQPAILGGLRGNSYVEFVVTTADTDMHSGHYGGAAVNPLHVVGDVIAGLHNADGSVAVPGFYDNVVVLESDERERIAKLPFDLEKWKAQTGVRATALEEGYSVIEATTVRPCVDVHGVWGGYAGEGAKTVIAKTAGAKLSARLVPNQTGEEIAHKLVDYIRARIPQGVTVTTKIHGEAEPVGVDRNHPAIDSAFRALVATFDVEPIFMRAGGSIPAGAMIRSQLGTEVLFMGFGLGTDAIHAPDEHFGLDRFHLGIESIIRFLSDYGASRG